MDGSTGSRAADDKTVMKYITKSVRDKLLYESEKVTCRANIFQ